MTAQSLVDGAFERLLQRDGFVERPDQRQLALLLADCIQAGETGAFEAPTGLGKSLAALIPAIACAIADEKRTVIATYTNVLAEQYWRKDLPLALELFEGTEPPSCQFLIGRQRYACLAAAAQHAPPVGRLLLDRATLGIESEYRQLVDLQGREISRTWASIAAPPVCPARLCDRYDDCFYYRARRAAERASIVITNHSVVLQDALLKRTTNGAMAILGKYDYLVVDEAHDLPEAAMNALEFELNESKLAALAGLAGRLEQSLAPAADAANDLKAWLDLGARYRDHLEAAQRRLAVFAHDLGRSGILAATPDTVFAHPRVRAAYLPEAVKPLEEIALEVADRTSEFVAQSRAALVRWKDPGNLAAKTEAGATDALRTYAAYLDEYAWGCRTLFQTDPEHDPDAVPLGAGVTYLSADPGRPVNVRRDVIDLAGPLESLLWSQTPAACLSATLALDGGFDYFTHVTGVNPRFREILPSPFDFQSQSALFMPSRGAIPDPSEARQSGREFAYFDAIAQELGRIIRAVEGRTLALFHSRREMEEVHRRIVLPPDLPVLMQRAYGAASVGDRFRSEVRASLFALRSYWTGFDAPGETLSCVVLVRVPFEVPVDPPQIARMAWLEGLGRDAFASHTLPKAKMLMRQGAGRLIRRSEDSGLIAILDPRVQTKRYGDEILANLPPMRAYDDLDSAVGRLGLASV
ncbi:MAG TPA: ATP-dependent DNA helicase [Fimbriimonadaceae bacterium]|nr:ATP-dependent DNA helicase [Fimbriimonadaceae bacterium]HRJ96668.1 ATP-dependent DNA helicase [Fimbriimonadaceae bacterium]